MKLVPLGDKIIVQRLEADEATAGGILLPDTAKEKPRQGKVLSTGDGYRLPDGTLAKLQVSEGDRVVFGGYGGDEVQVGDETLIVMSESDILAVLE